MNLRLPLIFLFALSSMVFVCSVRAQQVTGVDVAKSEIRFVTKQMNVPVEGKFRKFSAQVDFDPAKLASSKAQIEVDLGSIDTGSSEADTEVKGKAWFNLPVFPTAKFVSTGLKSLGGGRYEAAAARWDGIHRSETFPGLWLDGAAMLRGDMARVLEVARQGLASEEHAAFVKRLAEARK